MNMGIITKVLIAIAILAVVVIAFNFVNGKQMPADLICITCEPTPVEPEPVVVVEEATSNNNNNYRNCDFDNRNARCKLEKWDWKHFITIDDEEHTVLYNENWDIPRFYVGNRMFLLEDGNIFTINDRTFEFANRKIMEVEN